MIGQPPKFISIFIFCIVFMSALAQSVFATETSQKKCINIVSLVRGRQAWIDKNLSHLEKQAGLITTHNFASTWLVDYDALNDVEIIEKINGFPKNQEIGVLLEVTPSLAKELNLPFDKLASLTRPQNVFLSGYSQRERHKIIDHVFKKYKDVFLAYPAGVGAWFIDSESLKYLKDKYDIDSSLIVAEQYGTDHHTVRGHPWQVAYYPSQNHSLIPANYDNKIDVVLIQWAAREPLRGYGLNSNYSNFSVQANDYTKQGLNESYFKKLLSTYLDNPYDQTKQLTLGIEVGQEGAEYNEEFSNLIEVLSSRKDLRSTTMAEFSNIFKENNTANPALRFSSWTDDKNTGYWAGWVSTNFYRVGLLANDQGVWIRDLRAYGENQDDLNISEDKRGELIRQSDALIDEIGLDNKWLLLKGSIEKSPEITKNNQNLLIKFGDKELKFEPSSFNFNFKPDQQPNNLNFIQSEDWHTFVPEELEGVSMALDSGWQVISAAIFIGLLILMTVFKWNFDLLAFTTAFASLLFLTAEISTLTPINDLGLGYLLKIPPNFFFQASLSFIIIPALLFIIAVKLFKFVKQKTKSIFSSVTLTASFLFGTSLGWIFPFYRKLPLDPGLVSGTKSNMVSFLWNFRSFSLEKLEYAFSEGQMNIDSIQNLFDGFSARPWLIIIPITVYLIVNFGIILLGYAFILSERFKKRSYLSFLTLLLFLLISSLFVNSVDIRFPTLLDFTVNLIGILGIVKILTLKIFKRHFLQYLFISILVINLLPAFQSLLNRNDKLFIRHQTGWNDRKKIINLFNKSDSLTDVYLLKIVQANKGSAVFIPWEIEEYLFLDYRKEKFQTLPLIENSYGYIGTVNLN